MSTWTPGSEDPSCGKPQDVKRRAVTQTRSTTVTVAMINSFLPYPCDSLFLIQCYRSLRLYHYRYHPSCGYRCYGVC